MTTIAGPQSSRAQTHDWLTPPHVLQALGPFDLDPCAYPGWPTAKRMISLPEDGLNADWEGRVFLNPPYSREAPKWIARMAAHQSGIALLFARTDTAWFIRDVWLGATALLFLKGRVFFHRADGSKATDNGGAPSVLVAYSEFDADWLRGCSLPGTFVRTWQTRVMS